MTRRPGRLARAMPAMLRTGWQDAVAYRGEFIVWMLTMTLPLIMLALFRAVAEGGTVGPFDARAFTAYYLAGLLVRQLASAWVVWEINREIREGALAMRLLRPIHPLWSYLADSLAAIPLRACFSVPITLAFLFAIDRGAGALVAHDAATLAMFLVSLALAFLLAFAISAFVGALALYFESALGVWHVYIGLYAILSGYLVPLQLFPTWLRQVAQLTPFPYLQAVPVEILLGHYTPMAALRALAAQGAYVTVAIAALLLLWRGAQKRFAAYGG